MIHVKWNRDTLHFPLPPPDTPLGTLRAELAAWTQLPVGSFKLVYKGAVMKEDAAPLSTYKLKENATIALIGGDPAGAEKPPKSGPGAVPAAGSGKTRMPQTEASAIVAIRDELARVRGTLIPEVAVFLEGLGEAGVDKDKDADADANGPMPTPMNHTRLSELLLQSLLRLDAVCVPGVDWPEARVERKAAVREVQAVLDRLDGAWAARRL